MAPHSSTLAWKIPWMEEPGRLQSMGSLRVRHDWATSLSLFTFMHWRRKWQPTPVFLPGESQGRGIVRQSRTWLKWLSISISINSSTSNIAFSETNGLGSLGFFSPPVYKEVGFREGLDGKESACNVGDLGSIFGSGRPPAGGQGNPLQYSCLENPMDRGAWLTIVPGVAKSWTRLSN